MLKFLLSFIGFSFCNNLFARIGTNEIKFINKSKKIVNSYYIDNLASFGHPINLSQSDSISIFSDTPLTLFIADALQTIYILKPNHTYCFTLNNGFEFLECVEMNEVELKEFHFFEKLNLATIPLRVLAPVNFIENDYEHRQPYIDSLYLVRINFLNRFYNKGENNEFKRIAHSFIDAYYIKESLTFPKSNKNEFVQFLNSYVKKVEYFHNKLPRLDFPYYYPIRESAFAYQDFLELSADANLVDSFGLKNNDTIAYKFYITSKLASNILNTKETSKLDSIKLGIYTLSLPTMLYNELLSRLSDRRATLIRSSLTLDKVLTLDSSMLSLVQISKYKEKKLVYLDIWASWCTPCREEFSHEMKLKEKFKNEKIEYLFLSMDASFNSWKRALKEYPLLMNITNSFLMVANFKSNFSIKYKINSIPRYVIMTKEGKIIDNDAPAPSDPKLIPLLNRLLTH